MKNRNLNSNHTHPHNAFDNPEMFIEKFDGAERDEWQKPDEVIESFKLSDDAVVVEIGSGTGYFTVRLAEHIKNGKITAFDQSANMTAYLKNRVNKIGLDNVKAHTSAPDGNIALGEKADLIFSVDVYHHVQDRTSYFSKLASLLKSEGKLIIIDRTEEKIKGQPSGHRVPAEKAKEEMKLAGFDFVENLDFLLPIQYYLIFKPTP